MGTAYEPDVTPGDATSVRELPGLVIRKISVSGMHNNVYLLTDPDSGGQLLIDAADDAPRILDLIGEGGDRLDAIVTTHRHADHTRALREVASRTRARTYAGADDAHALPVAPDVQLRHGDVVEFGGVRLAVIHLRGHTPGSIALAYADPSPGGHVHLFTGDSLFPGGLGNTKNPEQSFASLYRDVVSRVFDAYDDDTWVYPGHGSDTTLGAERPHLAAWLERGW